MAECHTRFLSLTRSDRSHIKSPKIDLNWPALPGMLQCRVLPHARGQERGRGLGACHQLYVCFSLSPSLPLSLYLPLFSFSSSFLVCYNAEFSPLPVAKEGGVALEHVISCVPGVDICTTKSGVKVIQFQENREQFDSESHLYLCLAGVEDPRAWTLNMWFLFFLYGET